MKPKQCGSSLRWWKSFLQGVFPILNVLISLDSRLRNTYRDRFIKFDCQFLQSLESISFHQARKYIVITNATDFWPSASGLVFYMTPLVKSFQKFLDGSRGYICQFCNLNDHLYLWNVILQSPFNLLLCGAIYMMSLFTFLFPLSRPPEVKTYSADAEVQPPCVISNSY